MTTTEGAIARPRITKVRPDSVTTDLRVQRQLDQRRVDDLVRRWRNEALGVPTISVREDSTTIVIDGQTRFAALKEMGRGHLAIECLTYRELTLEQEAELFRELNDSKRLTPVDLFRIAITEGDPIAIGADLALSARGWTSDKGRKNSIAAVNTLYKAYERDPEATRQALNVLSGAWGATSSSAQAHLLQGVFAVCFRYGKSHTIEIDRLIDKVAKEVGGPAGFIGRARSTANLRGITVPDAVSDLVVNIYNRNKKTGVLPSWQTA